MSEGLARLMVIIFWLGLTVMAMYQLGLFLPQGAL